MGLDFKAIKDNIEGSTEGKERKDPNSRNKKVSFNLALVENKALISIFSSDRLLRFNEINKV